MNRTIVLIPHFNNPEGLVKSITSIKEKVDILIVDDGSYKKPNETKINAIFSNNGFVYFEYLAKNLGIEHALNHGLKKIINENKHQYIARLDCGDICKNNRFKIQKSFLEKNKDIAIVGSNVIFKYSNGKLAFKLDLPTANKKIKEKMYLNSMLIHPTICFRRKLIEKIGLYPTTYEYAEDLGFFFKIMKEHKLSNINEYLVECEYNEKGISISNRKKQLNSRIKIIKDNFYFGLYPILGLFKALISYVIPVTLFTYLKNKKNGK